MTENNSFDPKWPETHFLPRSTWFDPYWLGGLGFDPKTAWNSFFTLVDMVWPVLTRWTRFWPETAWNSFLPWSTCFDPYWLGGLGFDPKTHFYLVDMVWPVLTRWNRFLWKDAVDSRKIYFWIFLFLNFFWMFINNNRNKITFEKILVDPKLGYNSCPLSTMLTVQRHWKIHFLLTLHSKFCKEKRWKCWKIHRFFQLV